VTFMPKWQSSITLCELLQLCTAALQLMQQHHDSDVHAKMAIIHHTLWTAAAVHCCTAAERALETSQTVITPIWQSFIAPCALPQVWANSKQSVPFGPHKLYCRNKAIIHCTLCTAAGVGKLKAECVLQSSQTVLSQ